MREAGSRVVLCTTDTLCSCSAVRLQSLVAPQSLLTADAHSRWRQEALRTVLELPGRRVGAVASAAVCRADT
jgi:hypothetical protein